MSAHDHDHAAHDHEHFDHDHEHEDLHHHAGPQRGHAHGHSHAHGHAHAPARFDRAFLLGIVLNGGFVAVEIAVGLIAGSMALVADAGHNFADVLGLALAWGASALGRRQPSPRRTYGLRRSSILASLTNAVVLLIGVGGISVEAIRRLFEPSPVETGLMIAVALAGIAINGVTAMLFLPGRDGDLNIRAAFLHLAGDALVSVGVVAAGLAIRFTGFEWIDPVVGLVIAGFITLGTWGVLRESLNLALDGVPAEIDPAIVTDYLARLPGVSEVHDLHIWAMSTTETALTAHLVRPGGTIDDALLARACRDLEDRFRIHHATLQVEAGDAECHLAPVGVV
jgi:cobalt-zinc-cadmium efflux system protein